MKKLLILIVIMCSLQSVHSQEVYFSAGKNYTTYDFKNSSGTSNNNLKSGNGNFFELGIIKPLKNQKLAYSVGLALNEYNSVGGNSANSYTWKTQYLGAQGGITYCVLDKKDFSILPKFGLNMGTIISGKQTINGTYYDLTNEKEFSGLLITPSLGVQVKYNLSPFGFISLGYSYCKGINISNSTDQKLSFNTNKLQFGVHYAIK